MLYIRAHGNTPRAKEMAQRLDKLIHALVLEQGSQTIFGTFLCGFKEKVKISSSDGPKEMEMYIDAEIYSHDELGLPIPIDPPRGWKPKQRRCE
jgi:hypothetical protein